MLSNLINNAVEALLEDTGRVDINIHERQNRILIEVKDNGRGIPSEILGKLGTSGVTHGKVGTESGNGLGFAHAKESIERFGGAIEIASITKGKLECSGTKVTIILPKAKPPEWFVSALFLTTNTKLVALDDDQSIHGIWQRRTRFAEMKGDGVELLNFTNLEVFSDWLEGNVGPLCDYVFLIDYEFPEKVETGLDLIERLHLQKQSILVTSRYDEIDVLSRCIRQGIRLIPKAMAAYIPIRGLDMFDYEIDNEVDLRQFEQFGRCEVV